MAQNVLYADLNLPEPTGPRILMVPDVQGKSHCSRALSSRVLSSRVSALVAVLVVIVLVVVIALYLTLTSGPSAGSQNGSMPLSLTSQEDPTKLRPSHEEAPGKSCCSTTRVAVLVTEIILLLLVAVFQIIPCRRHCSRAHIAVLVVVLVVAVLALTLSWTLPGGPNAGSQNDSTTLSPSSQQVPTTLSPTIHQETPGCPPSWKKHGTKCYFFSPEKKKQDWKSSREECAAMGSDLVIIDSKEELNYLLSESKYGYYLLGLTYSQEEQKWKWINNMEHDPNLFRISRPYSDYNCLTIGYDRVGTAPCYGSGITQILCEKAATMSKRHQKES